MTTNTKKPDAPPIHGLATDAVLAQLEAEGYEPIGEVLGLERLRELLPEYQIVHIESLGKSWWKRR